MSYKNKCQGWANPSTRSNLTLRPNILTLSTYQSPSGSNTVVVINGSNFYSFSSIRFGTFTPTVYFINSNLIEFYVPNTLNAGTIPLQVFNGSMYSNIVNYTIDNASGYWLLNPNGAITNTNNNGIGVSYLSRGPPINIDNSNFYSQYAPIKGVLMEFNVYRYDVFMKLSAQQVNKQEIEDIIFEAGSDYKKVSKLEMDSYFNPTN